MARHTPPATTERPFWVGRDTFGPGGTAKGTLEPWVISLTLRGAVRYDTPGGPLFCRKGDVLLVRPRTPQTWHVAHEPEATGPSAPLWETIYCTFTPRPHWHAWLSYAEIKPGYIRLTPRDPAAARRIGRAMAQMHRIFNTALPERADLALNALERALLWLHSDQERRRAAVDPRVAAALAHVAANLAEPLSLTGLARACHASRSHLAHLFERDVGVPPMKFVERQRIERARQMLAYTAHPVKQVAAAVGYQDPKHFAKRFRALTGATPKEHRTRERRASAPRM